MKTFWITGASSGIGEALTRTLADAGHTLIISARNALKLQELRSSVPHPERVHVLPFDLADLASIPEIVRRAQSFCSIDVVILNAGRSQRSLAQETSFEVYRELMNVNYLGNVALTQSLLPSFVNRNSGQFVVISSLVGKFGTPYRSGYSASKHALHGYFDSLRAEMMMQNLKIAVTIICPGFVQTEISFNALGPQGEAIHQYDHANSTGLKPDVFARKAARVIEAQKLEAYIGRKEVFGVYLKRFFPSWFAKVVSRAKVR
jgi:short-subunit dehydrogenase